MRQACAQNQVKAEVVPSVSHSAQISSVAFSPDGRLVLSGSYDNTVRLWEAVSGQLIRTFAGHSGWVTSVAFSADGKRVLSGSYDNTLKLWDAASGQLIRTFVGHAGSVAGPRGTLAGAVNSVAFSPDGSRVLSGSNDMTLKLWDAASGQLIRTFAGHSDMVTSVAFSPDGRRVLSGSWDKALKLWDAASGQLIRSFEGHADFVSSVAFSPDGSRVLSSGWDKVLKLWDAASGQLLRTFEGAHPKGNIAFAFSPDGSRVLAGGDSAPELLDAMSGQLISTFEGRATKVYSVAFSPDGNRLLSGGADKTLKLWDVAGGQLIRTFAGHSQTVTSVAFSPDGSRILSGGNDSTVRLWDTASGRMLRTFEGHTRRVAVAFSPDGRRVLSGSDDETLRLWDAASGQLIRTFAGAGFVFSVAFSPDGSRVLAGGTGGGNEARVKLWDAESGQLVRAFFEKQFAPTVLSVAFSPDGRRVLSGSSLDNTVNLWDAASGQLVRTLKGHSGGVQSVAFSRDGKRVLSGSHDNTVRLWDAASGQPIHTFEGRSGGVYSVTFSPDGNRVLSGSGDGTMRVWDARTGRQWASLLGSRNGQWLAMTPEGFFAGSANDLLGLVRGFDVTTIDQVHQSLYNPDLVRAALAGDPDGEVAKAAKAIDLDKVVNSGPAPRVSIASPASGSPSAVDVITVTTRIEDRGTGVGRIEWRVNGVTAAVAAKPEGPGPVYSVNRELALDRGDSVIEVIAYNGSNLLASAPARTTVKFTGPVDRIRPKLHILAIGINDYIGVQPLGLAVNDATAFGADMKKAAGGLYDDVRVTLALNADATRDNLHRLVAKIADEVHPRDTFILFAAGHGKSERGRFYLIPQDFQPSQTSLAQGAIGQDDLQDWLANRIKAGKALILIDTCESGALVAGHKLSRVDAPASEAAIGRLHEATGRPVLTAAAADQEAAERDGHGLFTYAVLDALRKGDRNGNGFIELSELVAHVQDLVPKLAAGAKMTGGGERGLAVSAVPKRDEQSARFGSRGEDFVLAGRLQQR